MRTRRSILFAGLALPALIAPGAGLAGHVRMYPICGPDMPSTRPQVAGPFYLDGSPERSDLSGGDPDGRRMELYGCVLDRECHKVEGARVDLWQADSKGRYDTGGYRLRGHQISGSMGTFQFVTVIPGAYPGRTPHFHVRVTPPVGIPLTTQLYFPDQEAANARDGLFHPSLLLKVTKWGEVCRARFDFILPS